MSRAAIPDSLRSLLAPLLAGEKHWATDAIDGVPGLDDHQLDAAVSGLDDDDPLVRWWCLRLLLIPEPRPQRMGWLGRALKDADPDVRVLAAMVLHEDQEMEALPLLIEALNDTNEIVRDRAADSIGSLGQCSTEPGSSQLLAISPPWAHVA